MLFLIFISCTKNKLNPGCWGSCNDGKFRYISGGCNGIKGYLVLNSDDQDTFNVVGSVPRKYRNDGIDINVCITFTEISDAQYDEECIHFERTLKLKCIEKK